MIAYEPVWAIGTGRVATTDQIRSAHRTVRSALDAGGRWWRRGFDRDSLRWQCHCRERQALFAEDRWTARLVGGASLDPLGFRTIAEIASRATLRAR